jgi:beta-lactamase class C
MQSSYAVRCVEKPLADPVVNVATRFLATLAGSMLCMHTGRAADSSPVAESVADAQRGSIGARVDEAIRPLMREFRIPGVAVGIIVGRESYVFNFGVASTQTGKPVTNDTLFELGSISKTFTATLTSYAAAFGRLSLSDTTEKYLPLLKGSEFGKVSLLNLGTHTPGGLPLQVPDGIHNDEELLQYLKNWRPSCGQGTCRTYSNPGIGTLGLIVAKAMGGGFDSLMEKQLFPALGLRSSYINVPGARMADYAEGYTTEGAPVRMTPGELWAEAYGVRSTAADMVRFIEANMARSTPKDRLQRAIEETHTGYFHAGVMTQDLIWEQYPYPVALQTLLAGNSPDMLFNATQATEIVAPERARADVWINKTGSTNGFGAYVAFVPERRLGIVMLANKDYPIEARVAAAYTILTSVSGEPTHQR